MTENETESCCEVVKIVSVDRHPNADRLEIAKFAFKSGIVPDYQVVTGKGDFRVGDHAVYISDDMMVPIHIKEFEFLKTRLDYKGTTHYRVKAAKLRGHISTGLFVKPAEEWKLGTDVSKYLGVIKYVSPADAAATAHSDYSGKKLGWFDRLIKRFSKKFFPSAKVPEYGVLSLRKVPDLFTEGEPVIVTEKIHGSNIRFGKIGRRIYIGSHRTEKTDSRPWILRKLFPAKRGAGFYGTDVWSKWFNRIFDNDNKLGELPNNIIFYGELFGPGIQPWTYGLKHTEVMVYDAYDTKSKRWLDRVEVLSALPLFIKTVPTFGVSVGGIDFNRDDIRKLAEGNTEIKIHFETDPAHKCNDREGVVVRSVDWKKAGKLVSDRYLASEH